MSENQQSNHDLLEDAMRAFQAMPVCERPPDREVLAAFGACQGDLSKPAAIPIRSKRRRLMHLSGSAIAAAVLLAGGLALFLRNSSPPESGQVVTTDPSRKPQDVAVQSPSNSEKSEKLSSPSLRLPDVTQQEIVAESQVIVVATGLDSVPTLPAASSDLLIRWQVKRVLKGEFAKKEIITRETSESVASANLIGNDWVIFLTPDYIAGKHQLASRSHIDFEHGVKQLIAKQKQ